MTQLPRANTTSRRSHQVPVLIVGGGPSGLAAALFLARYGVRPLLVTKYAGTANSPRAHITNQRTVEILRDMGIEDRVLARATPNELMGNNVWATSLAGREVARLETWGTSAARRADYAAASPSPVCNIPQHLLEPILAEAAAQAGAELRFSHELVSLTQDDAGVTSTLIDRTTEETVEIRSEYVIGADGARSKVVSELGLPLEGESGLGAAMNVWFEADLSAFCSHRPSVLYWITSPGNDYWVGSGTLICVKPWSEWVMLFMYDPREGEPDTRPETMVARVRKIVGDPGLAVTIKSVSSWQMNHVVASRYAQGRVFCAGDAVHRHPPANGLGSNTSIQDSYNLAWKLAFVLRGEASPALLDSYDLERQPVGKQVVDRAMKSVVDMRPIAEALGFRQGQTEQEGWDALDGLDRSDEVGRRRREALDRAIALQNYQFNAHGVELNQRYRKGALVADGRESVYPRDPELYYTPTTSPGARLPHAWLERDRRRVSTLDLVGGGKFTLLTRLAGQAWADAANEAAKQLGVSLPVHQIGGRGGIADVYGTWAQLCEIGEDGCVLVRPDGHVAWRSEHLVAHPGAELRRVLGEVLGRS